LRHLLSLCGGAFSGSRAATNPVRVFFCSSLPDTAAAVTLVISSHGIMEYWNGGVMGSDKEISQIQNDFFPIIHPMFQYSNIPVFHM
jgi:hypothetical protein